MPPAPAVADRPASAATSQQLKLGDQILAEEKHVPLYKELVDRFPVEFIAGGATQNTVRVAQWMLKAPGATAYFGAVGADAYADELRRVAKQDGVDARYHVDPEAPTGTCAACIVGGERSLVANLAAANNYKVTHLEAPENWAALEAARAVYSAGFFITVCPEAMLKAARHCAAAGKPYCLNLSAPFICQVPPFKAALTELLPLTEFLFGNENEARAFAESEGWATTDVAEIAAKAAALPREAGARPRVVVFTQGADPTVVATAGGGAAQTFPVERVPAERLVDTNGAGDAFVGGFLAQLVKGRPVGACVRAGHYAASEIVQRSGCTLPAECAYSEGA